MYAHHYDEGRVHVYLTNKGRRYTGVKHTNILQGSGRIGERFGSTIVDIGDIDRDGYVDIAIGAPGGEKGISSVVCLIFYSFVCLFVCLSRKTALQIGQFVTLEQICKIHAFFISNGFFRPRLRCCKAKSKIPKN